MRWFHARCNLIEKHSICCILCCALRDVVNRVISVTIHILTYISIYSCYYYEHGNLPMFLQFNRLHFLYIYRDPLASWRMHLCHFTPGAQHTSVYYMAFLLVSNVIERPLYIYMHIHRYIQLSLLLYIVCTLHISIYRKSCTHQWLIGNLLIEKGKNGRITEVLFYSPKSICLARVETDNETWTRDQ